jgi:vesicle transport through interaction with t-SNAREs protein 1
MDTEPTALFNAYEKDLQQVLQSIQNRLDGAAKDQRGGEFHVNLATTDSV